MARRFRSISGDFWGGICPECLIIEAEMKLNKDHVYECPLCHMQVRVQETIIILPELGTGNFVGKNGVHVSVMDIQPPPIGIIAEDLRT